MNTADLGSALGRLKRHPFCVACGALVLIGGVLTIYFWQHASSITDIHADMEKRYSDMLATQRGGQGMKTELAHVKEYTSRIDDNLLVEDDVADNKRYFLLIESESRARLDLCEQFGRSPPLEEGELFRHITFNIKVTGTYDQVAAFLQGVETGPRLTLISSFGIRRTGEQSSPLTTMDFVAVQLAKK